MIASKHIGRVVLIAVAAAVIFCVLAMLLAPHLADSLGGAGVRMEYEEKLFDTSEPITVNILMDEDDWQNMLDTAQQEVYHPCDVVINGTKFQTVGIRPKGNTSLSSIAMNPNTDRYSFKLEFDQYIDGQTAWGLDKLCLNNNYADATNMKEALIYDMYRYLGADASLYNYAEIYVNDEYWGVYLALEAVEDSFLLRNYGVTNGELYKPDSMGIGFGDRDEDDFEFPDFDFDLPDFFASREVSAEPEETAAPAVSPDPSPPDGRLSDAMLETVERIEAAQAGEGGASGEFSFEMPDFGGGPFGGSGGQNLNYIDDDLDSYSTIWKCEVTRTGTADHKRVVQALKNISEGVELEASMDIDNLLRYMAVHNFSVNGDSLSGGMAHNYYLYENGRGRLNVIPWDYNLALGGMGMGGSDADEVVNDPIDDSWASTSFFDPLLEGEEYLARYHAYYRQLMDEYVFGGGFDEFYERTRAQIDELVATDPNALYDYDEYDAAAVTLYELVKRRGESVEGQLDGTIPSTTQGQRQDSSALVDASDIDISVMGTMSFGGSFGGGGGFPGGFNPFRGSGEPSGEEGSAEPAAQSPDEPENDLEAEEDTSRSGREASGEFPFASGEMRQGTDTDVIWTLAACGVVLIAGLTFAWRFRRRGY